jgi:transcriptional regulator with XRE-family HTH domain
MVTSTQIRMARAATAWTVRELAEKSGVHRNTIVRVEAGEGSHGPTLAALKRAFEDVGIEFLDAAEGVGGPGVRWKLGAKIPYDKKRETGVDADGDGSPSAHQADAEELAAYWRGHPQEWAALSQASRHALSADMFGDAYAADEAFET